MSLADKAAAWRLIGQKLQSGWEIVKPLGWDPVTGASNDNYNGTGGHFSVPYVVSRDGRNAFLKAIDLSDAIGSLDVMGALRAITSAHRFESQVLEACGGGKMDRIVVAVETGQISLGVRIEDTAPYIIFELADGDVRRRVQKVETHFRLGWWLRAMHHTTVGLSQLHSRNIAHQDLKPSNVLAFGNKADFRVSDLGRSIWLGTPGPYDEMAFSGDYGYAPPEILYGEIDPDWQTRRLGSDLYLLGSMVVFFVTGFGCSQHLFSSLPANHKPMALRGTWAADYRGVLPILQSRFTSLIEILNTTLPPWAADDLTKAVSELCNLDPHLRGHPLERVGHRNRFSLTRYVSLFDRLAKKAEIQQRSAAS
jgi:eukaryotic-like serine/threonine-protein kinase